MVKAKIENNSLPPDKYNCTFEGVEETTHIEYGDGWKWIFEVAEGDHEGAQAMRTTKDKPTPKNSTRTSTATSIGLAMLQRRSAVKWSWSPSRAAAASRFPWASRARRSSHLDPTTGTCW